MWYGVGEIMLVLCGGSGDVNRGHVSLFCAYVDNVNDCRVSVGANERLHRRWGGCRFRFEFSARR